MESTLSSPCSRSFIPLSLAKVRISLTLTLSTLTIRWYGLMALFILLLAKAATACLPTVLSVVPRPLFPFQQAKYTHVFLLKPGPFCKFFAGLGSTNKSVTSLIYFSYLTLALSSPSSLLLLQSLSQIWQKLSSLSSCSIRLQWVPGHSFLPENNPADKLARRVAILTPSAIP